MALYQVRDWNENFEGAKSRTYSNKTTCQMPTKHGLGYKRLVRRKAGPALFGAWCALVQVLSRHQKERCGYCTDTGRIDGAPYTPADLAMLTDIPETIFSELLQVASSQAVGWLRILKGYCADTTGPLHSDLDSDSDSDSDSNPDAPEARADIEAEFEAAWKAYPDKSGKTAALAAYRTHRKAGDALEQVLAGIARYRAYVDGKRASGHDLKWRNGSTFFNQACWRDEWEAEAQAPVAASRRSDLINTWHAPTTDQTMIDAFNRRPTTPQQEDT